MGENLQPEADDGSMEWADDDAAPEEIDLRVIEEEVPDEPADQEEVTPLEAPAAPAPESEKVEKAEKSAPLLGKVKTVEDVEPLPAEDERSEAPHHPVEPEWGEAKPVGWSRGLWIASVAVVLVLVGAVALAVVFRKSGEELAVAASAEETEAAEEAALEWFRLNPDVVVGESVALFRDYAEASEVEDVLRLVRDRERVEPLIRARWEPWGSRIRSIAENAAYQFDETDGTVYFVLAGELEDFRAIRMYFVRENDRMRIDWEATTAYSEVPVSELARRPDIEDVEIRCVVEHRDVNLPAYPAEKYHAYALIFPDSTEIFWGFAPHDSEANARLLDALDRGRFLLDLKKSERVTLTVDAALEGAPGNYLLIRDFKHIEWVRP